MPSTSWTAYEAAALLERLMAGKRPPKRLPEIEPLGIVPRRSTDVFATDDARILQALRFIGSHACRPISVMDVVRHVQVPRTILQILLHKTIGRTIHQEIRRVQMVRARERLSRANVPIKRVALECGFKNVQYFTRAFQAATGHTPGQFRRSRWSDPSASLFFLAILLEVTLQAIPKKHRQTRRYANLGGRSGAFASIFHMGRYSSFGCTFVEPSPAIADVRQKQPGENL